MLKSSSQGDEIQATNGRPFSRGPQQLMNGIPPGMQQQQQQPPQPTQFMEFLKLKNIPVEQFQQMQQPSQAKVHELFREFQLNQLKAAQLHPANQQTVQGAYQQVAQTMMQQGQQRNSFPTQQGQMTPEQQRNYVQARQQVMNGGATDQELLRTQQQLQNRMQPEVQQMFQQQLLARRQQEAALAAQNGQNQTMQAARLLQQQLPAGMKPGQMTQQARLYRDQQLRSHQAALQRNQPMQQVPMTPEVNQQISIFMNSLTPEQRQLFMAQDRPSQSAMFAQWTRQQQQQQQQMQQQGAQLQYNPMAAQSMPGARGIPGQMVMVQNQAQNGVGGPAMMRQSTSGGGA
jgi:hypothetical protein